jgi:hypothetical protein
MANAAAGRDSLHVPCAKFAPIARTVLMLEYTFANIGDDLQIAVLVHRKATVRRNLIVVPDHEVPETSVRPVAVAADGEVMLRIEPVVLAPSQAVQSSHLQWHDVQSYPIRLLNWFWS